MFRGSGQTLVLPLLILLLYVLRVGLEFSGPPEALVRPLVATILLGAVIGAAVAILLRRHPMAEITSALISAALVSLLWAVGVADSRVVADFIANELLRRRHLTPMRAMEVVSGMTMFLALLTIVTAVTYPVSGVIALSDFTSPTQPSPATGVAPNVYILLLDARARSDTMEGFFGVDDEPFLDSLAGLGFDVYSGSTSNYNATELTLLSAFTGHYAEDFSNLWPAPSSGPAQTRSLRRTLKSSPLVDIFRAHGYEVDAIASPVVHVRFPDADRTIDDGGLTDLEVQLIASSTIGDVLLALQPGLILDDQRRRGGGRAGIAR